MADVYYCVWETAAEVAHGPVMSEGKIAINGTSTQSSAVMHAAGENKGRRVRIFADGKCFVTWGANPTAVSDGTAGRPFGVENPEFHDIQADFKIACIERT